MGTMSNGGPSFIDMISIMNSEPDLSVFEISQADIQKEIEQISQELFALEGKSNPYNLELSSYPPNGYIECEEQANSKRSQLIVEDKTNKDQSFRQYVEDKTNKDQSFRQYVEGYDEEGLEYTIDLLKCELTELADWQDECRQSSNGKTKVFFRK